MEQIAVIFGSVFVYWRSVLLVMAVGTAICLYLSLYWTGRKCTVPAMLSVLLAAAFSVVLSRLMHWYCRPDQYADLSAALTDYRSGGYVLAGAFAGCVLAACLLRLVQISRDLPRMLDCMAIAGSAGIAIGRLACYFNTDNRGMIVAAWTDFPWAWVVTNPVSGAEELRLATFLLQAIAAGILLVGLPVFWLAEKKWGNYRDGDVCLVFLLCYGASQVLLDSTRYDSLYFRSNGFVSIVQVLGACAIGLTAVLFSVRLVRQRVLSLLPELPPRQASPGLFPPLRRWLRWVRRRAYSHPRGSRFSEAHRPQELLPPPRIYPFQSLPGAHPS